MTPTGQKSRSFPSARALATALALVCFAVWWPVRQHEFLNYDDNLYVTENDTVVRGLTWEGFVEAFDRHHAHNWHPLTILSHMADVGFFGLNPGAHHLVNVALHAASAALLLLLLDGATGSPRRSLAVAALFALHPLRVESVAWIAERKDALCVLFWLLTLLAYAGYARRPSRLRMAGVGIVFALGLMTKPMIVTLPCALLLLDFWPLQRISLPPSPGGAADWAVFRRTLAELAREKIPLFVLAGGLAAATFLIQQGGDIVQGGKGLPLSARLGNALVAWCAYVWKSVWPSGLAVYHPHPGGWPLGVVAGAGLVLVAASWAVVRGARSRPWLFTGWFWYLGTLVPVIGLIQVGGQAMAWRYTYIPSIGLTVVAVWGAAGISRNWPRRDALLTATLTLALLACVVGTRRELRHWRDSVSLFARAWELTGDVDVAALNLGAALHERGRLEEAFVVYAEALQKEPDNPRVRDNLGLTLAAAGRPREALAQFEAALRVAPGDPDILNNLGNLLAGQGRAREAVEAFNQALKARPDDPETHNNLGLALDVLGDTDAAVAAFEAALRLRPDYPFALQNLGLTLAASGRLTEAIASYRAALKLKPDFPQAETALGLALAETGDHRQAIEHFRAALRLEPGFAAAEDGLARSSAELAGQAP